MISPHAGVHWILTASVQEGSRPARPNTSAEVFAALTLQPESDYIVGSTQQFCNLLSTLESSENLYQR